MDSGQREKKRKLGLLLLIASFWFDEEIENANNQGIWIHEPGRGSRYIERRLSGNNDERVVNV